MNMKSVLVIVAVSALTTMLIARVPTVRTLVGL